MNANEEWKNELERAMQKEKEQLQKYKTQQ